MYLQYMFEYDIVDTPGIFPFRLYKVFLAWRRFKILKKKCCSSDWNLGSTRAVQKLGFVRGFSTNCSLNFQTKINSFTTGSVRCNHVEWDEKDLYVFRVDKITNKSEFGFGFFLKRSKPKQHYTILFHTYVNYSPNNAGLLITQTAVQKKNV